MKEVTLKNAKRQPFLATVYHDIACRRAKECTCSIEHVAGPNGKRVSRKNPMSFQIDGMSTSKVPFSVLHLPQVQKALKSKWLVRVEGAPATAPKAVDTATAPTTTEEASAPTGRRGRR